MRPGLQSSLLQWCAKHPTTPRLRRAVSHQRTAPHHPALCVQYCERKPCSRWHIDTNACSHLQAPWSLSKPNWQMRRCKTRKFCCAMAGSSAVASNVCKLRSLTQICHDQAKICTYTITPPPSPPICHAVVMIVTPLCSVHSNIVKRDCLLPI